MTVPQRMRTLLTLSALAAGLGFAGPGVANASELPDGYGVNTPSGSTFVTSIGNAADCDDYTFQGGDGQTVSAKMKVLKGSALAPVLELIRPDGTVVQATAEGYKLKAAKNGKSIKLSHSLDATGIWKVRVRRDENSTTQDVGAYSIKIAYTKPKFGANKTGSTNAANQYTYAVPAIGGAEIKFTFSWKNGTSNFQYLTDPSGRAVLIREKDENENESIQLIDENGDRTDVLGELIKESNGKIKGKKIVLPPGLPLGNYTIGFNDLGNQVAPAGPAIEKPKFKLSVKLPAGAKKLKQELSRFEPLIIGDTFPAIGGPGTPVFVTLQNAVDEDDPSGIPEMFVGTHLLEDIQTQDFRTFTGVVPGAIGNDIGAKYDVSVRTSTGQVAVRQDAFTRVAPPVVTGISQPTGTDRGGFSLTIFGSNFNSALDNTGQFLMDILIDGQKTTMRPTNVTDSEVTFTTIPWPTGFVRFGVRDQESLLEAQLDLNTFRFLATAQISRVTPNLSPTLGGELISISGVNFTANDRVFITSANGPDEELFGTFQNDQRHAFTAPARPKGQYEVYVLDPQNQRTTGNFFLNYFTFADFTAELGLDGQVQANSEFDAYTSFLIDYNGDNRDDLILCKQGGASLSSTSLTTVLRNNGDGSFTNETDQVMPGVTAQDDYRADKVWLADLAVNNGQKDGYPELILATNSIQFPANNRSHVRIFQNVRRGQNAPAGDRAFSEITDNVMPTVRGKAPFSFNNEPTSIADNWRAQDMWVGDIDNSGADSVPEILIVHDEIKNEPNTQCLNYCTSPLGSGATYNFYWGGARAFFWNASERDGLGKFEFNENFFPRRSGVGVPIAVPGGGTIIGCSQPCIGKFTPFTGQKIAVGHLDTDGRLDIAVVNSGSVQRDGQGISSLQVAINRPNNEEGSAVTDVTLILNSIGADLRGTALAIGQPFGAFGTIAVGRDDATGGSALRLIQAVPSNVEGDPIAFQDVTSSKLPLQTADEKYQASAFQFADTNGDSLQDLVLVSKDKVGTDGLAFRILRAVVGGGQVTFEESFKTILEPLGAGGDFFDGNLLLLGDLNADGATEYIITRTVSNQSGSQTRAITTDLD